MDKHNNNIRRVKTSSSTHGKTKYNARKKIKYNNDIRPLEQDEKAAHDEYAKKQRRVQKKKRRAKRRLRALAVFVLTAVVVLVLVLLTPIFNIKYIDISGNYRISEEELRLRTDSFIGKNIFSVNNSLVYDALDSVSLIDKVTVSKKFFPPSLTVTVEESNPSGYFNVNGNIAVVDENLKVIENSASIDTRLIPEIRGVLVKNCEMGKTVKLEETQKQEALKIFTQVFTATMQTGNIDYIDLENIADLRFSYCGRIEVTCGSALELERKLRLFKETVTNSALDENANGTIDLSTPGNAFYTPYE